MSYLTMPFTPAFNALGLIAPAAKLKFCITETSTPTPVYSDPDLSTSLGSTVTADAFGRFVPIYLDPTIIYRVRLETALGALIQEADGITGIADYAIPGGSALIGFLQAGVGAVARTAQAKMRDVVSAFDFMTAAQIADVQARTLTLDVTVPLQAAIDACIISGKTLHLPAGNYKITSTLNLVGASSAYGINIIGEGRRYTTITLYTASTTVAAMSVNIPSNSSFIGGRISGIGFVCNGGAAKGRAIYMATTATNSAISQFELDNIWVLQTSTGIFMTGVIYMSTFRNITITGSVTEYGIYAVTAQEIIYNTFADIEVTGVEGTAYAYYLQTPAAQGRNFTADGCIYISSIYGCFKGVTIEGIHAATTISTSAIQLNQCDGIQDVTLINIPTAKCNVGIHVTGRCNIIGVRWPDAGAGNQPDQPLFLASGSRGTCVGYQTGRAVVSKVEAGSALADVNNWVFTNSADITDHDLSYSYGTWTPSFSGDFTTPPTVISATYTKVGRQVTVALYATDGVVTAGGVVSGLPFTAAAGTGFAVSGSSNDTTERISGSIIGGTTTINNIPANTLTGNFWQLSGTYFV